MSSAAGFWNRIARRYSRRPVADQASYEKKLEITQALFGADSRVLEIGCGTGSTALHHAPAVQHIRAVDFSSAMIAIAEHKRLEAGVSNVSFECASVSALDLPDRYYDAVLALSVLHLMSDWRNVIERAFATLKPGGVMVSSTACIGDDMAWFRYVAPLGRWLRLLPELVVMTRQDLEQTLVDTGFEVDQIWSPGKNKGVFIVARRPASVT